VTEATGREPCPSWEPMGPDVLGALWPWLQVAVHRGFVCICAKEEPDPPTVQPGQFLSPSLLSRSCLAWEQRRSDLGVKPRLTSLAVLRPHPAAQTLTLFFRMGQKADLDGGDCPWYKQWLAEQSNPRAARRTPPQAWQTVGARLWQLVPGFEVGTPSSASCKSKSMDHGRGNGASHLRTTELQRWP
jgi:hypothetical protein